MVEIISVAPPCSRLPHFFSSPNVALCHCTYFHAIPQPHPLNAVIQECGLGVGCALNSGTVALWHSMVW